MLETALYLAACLVLPAVWGWLAHRLFTMWGLHRRLPGPSVPPAALPESPSVWDYQI